MERECQNLPPSPPHLLFPSILRPVHILAFGLVLSDEIVKLRESRAANASASAPAFGDPGYRALVEENVKNSVSGIVNSAIMQEVSSTCLAPIFALP